MSGKKLTSGQKAQATILKRIEEKAQALAIAENIDIIDARVISKKEFYKNYTGMPKGTVTKKTKKAKKVKKVKKTEPLLNFSENIGKQMVYTGLLSLAQTLNEPLHALTMPGINTEFETRLDEKNVVESLSFIERDKKIQQTIIKNFGLKSWSNRSLFPDDYMGDMSVMRSASSLNFVWFDFMGKYLNKYTPAFREMIQVNEQTEMVFAITIGSRGSGKAIAPSQVHATLSGIFQEANWKTKDFLSCAYKSEGGTKMTVLMYSLKRSARYAKNKKVRDIEAQIKELQGQLSELSELMPKTKTKTKDSPQHRAWITRRKNAAAKAAKNQ